MSALTPLSLEDYDAIASAVMETERGRWFLAEFARRNRAADTGAVLVALAELEARLAPRQSPLSGSAEAAERIRAAASLAAGIRDTLTSVPKPRRQAGRALRQCAELEQAIASALEAVGEAPRGLESRQLAILPTAEAVEDHDDVEDDAIAALDAETASLDVSIEEPAAQVEVERSEVDDGGSPWNNEDRCPSAVILMNGEVYDLTDERAASPLPSPPPASSTSTARPVMPKAWTPGLLESLTEEEKAILFA